MDQSVCPHCGHANPTTARFCAGCGRDLGVVCPNCQTWNGAESLFCANCGARLDGQQAAGTALEASAYRSGPVAPAAAYRTDLRSSPPSMDYPDPAIRQRPVWLVVLLSIVTLGFYPIVWLGINWSAMKGEVGDPGMSPWGHALAQFVPIYNWFRFHAHFALIQELLWRANAGRNISPGWSLAGWILLGFVGFAFTSSPAASPT